jgi:hypothetical protein
MNTFHSATMRALLMALIPAVCFQAHFCAAQTKENPTETEFPYSIPLELGTSAFAPGDSIKITVVKGNRTHLDADGSYLVEGTYTLASVDTAVLLFSCSSPTPSAPAPIPASQKITVTRGSGRFALQHPPCAGQYHVSFYVSGEGHSHGGVYFGEKGFPQTVLRETDWPDFSSHTTTAISPAPSASEKAATFSSDPNRAIMVFLGNPVPAPADLDAKYAPTNLLAAFTSLSQKEGWNIQMLSVDDSEFPFLVYGLLAGDHPLPDRDIRAMKGYDYGGSVRGSTGEGSTYFALNMIPNDQYPSGQIPACNRRLMVRLQMLANLARRSK